MEISETPPWRDLEFEKEGMTQYGEPSACGRGLKLLPRRPRTDPPWTLRTERPGDEQAEPPKKTDWEGPAPT